MSSAAPDLPAQPIRQKRRPLATSRTVMALILREMSTRYGRSPGGYIWALFEPLGAIMILGVGFSLLLTSPPLGTSFFLFYATGFLPFNIYQVQSLVVSRAIGYSKPLLFYPAVTWVDAVLARFILNGLTSVLIYYILMTSIMIATDTRTVLDLAPIVWSTVLVMLLGLGVGVLNCALAGLFPTWDLIWSVITRPLFLMSGIFFLFDDMPQLAREILWWNPLIHVTGLVRRGLYPGYDAAYSSPIYVMALGLGVALLAGVGLMRWHRDILSDL